MSVLGCGLLFISSPVSLLRPKKKKVASTHLPNHFAMDKPLRIHGTGMCNWHTYLRLIFMVTSWVVYTRATYGLEGKFCPWVLVLCRHGMIGSLTTQLRGVAKCWTSVGHGVSDPENQRREGLRFPPLHDPKTNGIAGFFFTPITGSYGFFSSVVRVQLFCMPRFHCWKEKTSFQKTVN